MENYRYIHGVKFYRYRSRNMWIEFNAFPHLPRVYSYDTLIGYLDWHSSKLLTWGYKRYSAATSKQITMLCKELNLKKVTIEEI